MKIVLVCLLVASVAVNLNAGPAPKQARIFYNNDPMLSSELFEGDIQLDPEQEAILLNPSPIKGLNQVSGLFRGAWPNGVVPWVIDSAGGFTDDEKQTISDAMRLIEDQTRNNGKDCIKFVERTNEGTYIKITNQSGCWSYVGRSNFGGAQEVSFQRPSQPGAGHCIWKGTIAHELIHALGFFHEQSRSDRDDYTTIVMENVIAGTEKNFEKVTSGVDFLGQPYDVYSIMHYEETAFTINGSATIIPKDPNVKLVNAAYKSAITNIDVAELRKYYKC